ncbi:MAG: hypothetical protein OXN20_06070 [Gemmatimonadota bacterium]|nr:hypothetical protein [Gemmatimonadota bacterium]
MANKKTRAYSVLFEQAVGDDNKLFDNPTALAIKMTEWKIHSSDNSASLASYLNQTFSRGQRSCSSELQEQLNKAIDIRFQESKVQNSKSQSDLWKKRLACAIDADNADFGFPHPLNAIQLTYDFFERAEYAEEQFIITSYPPEFVLTEDAVTLQNILLRRLGLIDFEDRPESDEPKVRYTFNFPSEEMAERWWWALYDAVEVHAERNSQKGRASEEDIHGELKTLNEAGRLVVQVISPELCALPIVAFDPTEGNASAYVFFYFDGIRNEGGRAAQDSLSMAKLDRHTYMTWREAVYRPIRRGQIEAKKIEYSEIVLKT